MSTKSRLLISAQPQRLSAPNAAVLGEFVTILMPSEAKLPKRRSGFAQNRETQLTELL